MWITNGASGRRSGRVGGDGRRHQAHSWWRRASPGSRPHVKNKLSLRASSTAELSVRRRARAGDRSTAGRAGLTSGVALPRRRALRHRVGATVGAARASLASVLVYSQSSELFGRPLAGKQLIQARLAEAARRIASAQLLAWRLGRLKDDGAKRRRRRSRSRNGTTCGWRSMSRAIVATCWGPPASRSTTPDAPRHESRDP